MKRGRSLDQAIEKELQLMLVEGFEHSPVSHKSLHDRLIAKKVLAGGLSTLSTPEREPPRDCRRPNILREYDNEKTNLHS